MKLLEGLIFDLDGTLLDSAPDIRQAVNKMLEEDGRAPVSLDDIKKFVGDGAMEMVKRTMAQTGDVPEDVFPYIQKFVTHYRSLPPDPDQIFPEALALLKTYHAKGIKLGVCTNKQEESTKRLLESLGLSPYFSFIAGGDTFLVHKPNPGHLFGVIKGLGIDKDNCVFVGDGHTDIVTSQAAKVPCIIVRHGYGLEEGTPEPSAVIENFTELSAAIKNLGFDLPE